MTSPIRRIRLALPVAALLLAVPACAQRTQGSEHREGRGQTWISVNDHDGQRTELRTSGRVTFNDEGDWVTAVAPGAYLTAEERGRGPDRRIDFRPGDGGARVRYYVDGDERPLDAAGRAWAREMIGRAVRESGLGAEDRVARLRARGGVNAVLGEIAGLRSDTGRRVYYKALLAGGPMSNAEFARVMDDVGRRMGSDTETRLVLNRVAERHRLADAASRQAFFRAVGGMDSDTEIRLVLNAVAEQNLADGDARDAFFRAVGGMSSDVERRLVLASVLGHDPSEAAVVGALNSAAGMNSDVEKRLVLFQVPSGMLRNGRVTAAYRRVVYGMGSDTERGLALRRLAGGGR
jgi:hypothetical protein